MEMRTNLTVIDKSRREGVNLTRVAGVDEVWAMPVSLWHGPRGFDTSLHPDNKPHHTIAVRLSGSLVQRVSSCRSTVEKLSVNGFSIHPAGHDLRFLAASEIRFAHLHLSDKYLREVSYSLSDANGGRSDLLRDDRVMFHDEEIREKITNYIDRAFNDGDPPCRLEMDSLAALITLYLLKRHSAVGSRSNERSDRGKLAGWQVKTVCDFMKENLGRDISLMDLSSLVSVSPEHFCRAFRKSVGLPPYRWLQKRRIAHAQTLLSDRELSLTEVAQRVGYAGQSAFGTAFRKETGLTPSQFRREI